MSSYPSHPLPPPKKKKTRTKPPPRSLGLPVIAIAFVAIARLMKCCCRCHCFEKVVSFEMRFFFLLFNFSYIFIVARTLEVFDCEALPPRIVAAAANGTSAPDGSMSMVEEDTIHVLGAYPSIQCGSSEWVPIVVVGAIGFTLWGLCVPGFLCVRLFRRRSRFDEVRLRAMGCGGSVVVGSGGYFGSFHPCCFRLMRCYVVLMQLTRGHACSYGSCCRLFVFDVGGGGGCAVRFNPPLLFCLLLACL